ncbi:MAG: hypothetical protein J7501_03940 [Bdellovibrio sp.]|nr:hypothetical protein [Bdellovibrio sp.]
MAYAEKTKVPVDRSQAEIRKILSKHGASGFAFAEQVEKALVQFDIEGRRIRFFLPLAVKGQTQNKKRYIMGQNEVDQTNRSKWRGLALAIKAKLECVESGITTLEQEFMAHIALPNGQTVGDLVLPEIAKSYQEKAMPSLLGMRQ